MPTPKQVRAHMIKITKAYNNLCKAVSSAKRAGIIEFEKYEDGPYSSINEASKKIDSTTEKAILTAYREEIRKEVYGY